MSERLNQGIAGSGKLVFFRHQGRKWRNIPMVNVTCLKTTIWNFIEIREICDGSAAPELHITQPKFDQKKHGQFNFQYSHISLYFFYHYYFSGLAFADIMLGVSMAEANMSRVLWKLILTNHYRHSQSPAACASLAVFTRRRPAQCGPYNMYQAEGEHFAMSLAKSMPVSVQSIFILLLLKHCLAQYFVESKLSESPSYCHFEKLYV